MTYRPTPETVAVDWLRATLTLPDAMIDHDVPALSATFATNGAVTVTALGDDPDHDTRFRRSLVMLDCWSYRAGDDGEVRPNYGRAAQIAGEIVDAALATSSSIAQIVTRTGYDNAHVRDVRIVTGPLRRSDPHRMARYRIDARITWTPEVAA